MSDSDVVPRYFENPHNRLRHTFLYNWTLGDKIVAVLTLFAILAGLFSGNGVLVLLFGWILVLMNVRIEYARLWREIRFAFAEVYIGTFLGGILFLHDDLYPDVTAEGGIRRWFQLRKQAFVRWLRERRFRRKSRRPVFPIHVRVVRAAGEEYGIARQINRDLDHIFIAVDGSEFSSFDHETKFAVTNELAEAINQVSAQSTMRIGVSMVRATNPMSELPNILYFAEAGQPLIFNSERFQLDEEMQQYVNNALQTLSELPATHRAYGLADEWELCVVTIPRERGMRQAAAGNLSEVEISDLPLIELGRMMIETIMNSGLGARNVRCMCVHELSVFLRASWDKVNLDFHEFIPPETLEYVGPADIGQLAAGTDYAYQRSDLHRVKNALRYYPRDIIEVGHDWINMDGNFMSVIRTTKLKEQVPVETMQIAYHESNAPGVWTTASSVGEVISGTAETNTLYIMQSWSENFNGAFRRNRIVEHPKVSRRRNELSRRTTAMSRSSFAEQFNDLRVVFGTDMDDLKRKRKAQMGILRSEGLGCKVVTGKARQLPAVVSGLFATNQM
jgi:hypothetical protein